MKASEWMVWVKLDDQFAEHPKMQAAGPLGRDLQVSALCYCNRNLTDGYLTRATARRLADTDDLPGVTAQAIIDRLVKVGAWIKEPGGYRIHDYDHYQPTKAQVLAEREQKRDAGRKGGLAAAKARARARGKAPAKPSATAGAQAEPKQTLKQNPTPVPVPTASTEAVRTRAHARDPTPNPNGAVVHPAPLEEASDPDTTKQQLDAIRNLHIRGPNQ